MANFKTKKSTYSKHFIHFFKWIIISILISLLIGSASAFFLSSLEYVTQLRLNNTYLLFFLPIAGFAIGLLYYYYGGTSNEGNNLLIKEYHFPSSKIPLRMFPLVLSGTLITHLFGGSAGREGTAVQMGGAIADQFTSIFNLSTEQRKTLLLMGISGGFASIFGTPIAGTLFAIEIMFIGKYHYNNITPIALTAILSNYICMLWGITHTQYIVDIIPDFSLLLLTKVILISLAFGVTAILFVKAMEYFKLFFSSTLKYPPLQPMLGGMLIIVLYFIFDGEKYLGLGIPTISESFITHQDYSVFLLKILFTTITLSSGFKGGEVTPLFFIGATLGSCLALYFNLPASFIAGLGFVAVFAGTTKTPLACVFMGVEIFGLEMIIYLIISCFISYYVSNKHSIYKFQQFS